MDAVSPWWTLASAAVGALIAGVVSWLTHVWQERAERERRAEERAERDRERWLTDRRQVYTRYMDARIEMLELVKAFWKRPLDSPVWPDVGAETGNRLSALIGEMQLVGSPEAFAARQDHDDSMTAAIEAARQRRESAQLHPDRPVPDELHAAVRDAIQAERAAFDRLVAVFRRDLGMDPAA